MGSQCPTWAFRKVAYLRRNTKRDYLTCTIYSLEALGDVCVFYRTRSKEAHNGVDFEMYIEEYASSIRAEATRELDEELSLLFFFRLRSSALALTHAVCRAPGALRAAAASMVSMVGHGKLLRRSLACRPLSLCLSAIFPPRRNCSKKTEVFQASTRDAVQ